MESTAKIRSVTSTRTSTSNSGVADALARLDDEEVLARGRLAVIGMKRRTSLHDCVLFAIELVVPLDRHADAGDDQHRAEDVQNPVEPRDEHRAEPDEQAAHDQRAENSVEQHAVLAVFGTRKYSKISTMTKMLSTLSDSSMT